MSRPRFQFPAPAPQAPSQEAFVMFPVSALPSMTPEQAAQLRALYEWALNEAQAAVGPSLLERDLLGVWN